MRHGLRFVAAVVLTVAHAAQLVHDWDVPITKQSWVDFYMLRGVGPGGARNITSAQAQFIANNYGVLSLEKCLALPTNDTFSTFAWWSREFKRQNKSIKILLYFHSTVEFDQCYAEQGRVWDSHPEWWVRTDAGTPVLNGPYHVSNDSTPAADYWLQQVTAQLAAPSGSGSRLASNVDGVFVDGAGHPVWSGVSDERRSAAANASKAKLDRLRAAFPEAAVMGNTLSAYTSQPHFNMDFLPHLDGACAEHVASFEQVLPGKNALDVASTAGLLSRMWETAASLNKTVLARTWPGPVVTPIDNLGPTWHVGAPTTAQGRAEAAQQWSDWAVALYLVVATERTWLSYNWWYNVDAGVYPCAPGDCEAPSTWYSSFTRPGGPGKPLGSALRWREVGGELVGAIGSAADLRETRSAVEEGRKAAGVYTRAFANVNVTLDLGNMSAHLQWRE